MSSKLKATYGILGAWLSPALPRGFTSWQTAWASPV